MRRESYVLASTEPAQEPLRICRICGLKTFTDAGLEKFAKRLKSKYGRRNICKGCLIEYRRNWQRENRDRGLYRRRQLELIQGFGSPIICYFCGKEVTQLTGQGPDSLNTHSLDGNHDNWDPKNKVPTHRDCHSIYHNPKGRGAGRTLSAEHIRNISLSLQGSKHPNWRGDNVMKKSKYMREYRKRKREGV